LLVVVVGYALTLVSSICRNC